jgi:anti-sigma factor RsiW
LINLFVWPGESSGAGAQKRGFNVVHWSDGGMTFWAVSDLNQEELEKFSQLFRKNSPSPTSEPH